MWPEGFPSERFPELDLHRPPLEIVSEGEDWKVREPLRKRWLRLTPEEWVRQHVLFWLVQTTGFPPGLLSIERKVGAKGQNRADVVGYGTEGRPILLVECKAPLESISSQTAAQAMRYNQQIGARFIWLTNGKHHVVYSLNRTDHPVFLPILPSFNEMKKGESAP